MSDRAAFMLSKLTPKGLNLDGPRGGGGFTLSEMDVAAACSRLTREQDQLLRAKYCGDEEAEKKVTVDIWCRLRKEPGKIQECSKEALMRLAKQIAREIVMPPRCRRCKGRGHVCHEKRAIKPCPSCSGTGVKYCSQYARARALDLPESTWRHNRLSAVYKRVVEEFAESEIKALGVITRRLAG